jgi:hypothetical protein
MGTTKDDDLATAPVTTVGLTGTLPPGVDPAFGLPLAMAAKMKATLTCNACGKELPPLEPGESLCPDGYLCRTCFFTPPLPRPNLRLDKPAPASESEVAEVTTTPSPRSATATTAEEPSQITLTKCDTLEVTARAAWDAYSMVVGGKTYGGDPMPTWDALVVDSSKSLIVAGWKAAANAAVTAFFASTSRETVK